MSAFVVARFSVAGLHHWPAAPVHRAYLRDLHRHLFVVEIHVEVGHDDRHVEFHDLAEAAEDAFRGMGRAYHPLSTLVTFGACSCEQLAEELAGQLGRAGFRVRRVVVSEDGESDGVWDTEKAPA